MEKIKSLNKKMKKATRELMDKIGYSKVLQMMKDIKDLKISQQE